MAQYGINHKAPKLKKVEELVESIRGIPEIEAQEKIREWAESIITKCWQKSRIEIWKDGKCVRYDEGALIGEEYVGAGVQIHEESIMKVKELL